jgi:small GTP-binding protein
MEGRRQRIHSSPSTRSGVHIKDKYRLVVLGASKVGKTCLVSRMLHQELAKKYKATVEEFHQGEYEINGRALTLDILDTSGSYEFPAMRDLSIATGDAFILVYSIDDDESFERVRQLRQLILDKKQSGADKENSIAHTPIVIVGNKADLERPPLSPTPRATMETTVAIDWGHGFVEASAKDNINVSAVFKELLIQAKIALDEDSVVTRRGSLPNQSKTEKPKLGKRNSANCVIS